MKISEAASYTPDAEPKRMYHLTLRESALRARPRVNCESKAEMSNCEHLPAFCLRKSLLRDSLGNLL